MAISLQYITNFAAIDAAMLRIVKASEALESAMYSRSEGPARDRVVIAANDLKTAFRKLEKEVNDAYAREQTREKYDFSDIK